MKKALIVDGRVAGFDPAVTAGTCALVVDVDDDVQIGWVWTPEGCLPPAAPDPVAAVDAQLAALDVFLPRAVEDLCNADAGRLAKLSGVNKERLEAKARLRTERAALVTQSA